MLKEGDLSITCDAAYGNVVNKGDCPMEIRDKRILITGASRGIGYAVAHELVRLGADVFLTARSSEDLSAACNKLDPSGLRAHYAVMDISNEDSVKYALKIAQDTLGGIDILINNAGIAFQNMVWETDFDKVEQEIHVNYLGTYLVTRLVLPGMLHKKQGMILNVASLLGKVPNPTQANYGASKAAIIAFSSALRSEVEDHGIVVKVFMPGLTATEMTEALKFNAPTLMKSEEVAKLMIKFMKSEKPEYVCGLANRGIVNFSRFFPEGARKIMKHFVLKL